MERTQSVALLIRAGCRFAPQSTRRLFDVNWPETIRTQRLALNGTSAFGAALHAWGFLRKIRTYENLNAIAEDIAVALWPELFACVVYRCPARACGKVFYSFRLLSSHVQYAHGLSREDIADLVEVYNPPKVHSISVYFPETLEILRREEAAV